MAIYFCYVDESGGFEAPDSSPHATPLMVVAGLVVSADAVSAMTQDFIRGGVVVSDKRSRRPSSLLFRPPGLGDSERAANS